VRKGVSNDATLIGKPPVPGKHIDLDPVSMRSCPKGRFLLTAVAAPRSMFNFPGGWNLTLGETPLPNAQTARVREEFGWTIARPGGWGRFDGFRYMPEYGYVGREICKCMSPISPSVVRRSSRNTHGCYVGGKKPFLCLGTTEGQVFP